MWIQTCARFEFGQFVIELCNLGRVFGEQFGHRFVQDTANFDKRYCVRRRQR
jgi:hypothetical protein